MKFKKYNKVSDKDKQEIIKYVKEFGFSKVREKYGVWPDTVRYWIDPDMRERKKLKQRRYDTTQKSQEQIDREKAYRAYRQAAGISTKKYREWFNGLSAQEKENQRQKIRQHRIDNNRHYKKLAHKRYIESKQSLRERYKNDHLYKLKCNIREHIRQAIKYSNITKDHPSIKYLGCDIEDFKRHIEEQFVEGMSWENHGRGENCWHLDHIKPLDKLKDISDIQLIKEVCHYTNYQPLWEKENLSKNNKYEE